MADIFYDFPIAAPAERVFEAVSTPRGLDAWWTKRASGEATEGARFELWFGPQFDWRARVTRCTAVREFEFEMTLADADWTGTRIGFDLEARNGASWVRFHHTGWPNPNEHWRVSCYCWAMYLRLLGRFVVYGEVVPYERRLDA